MTNKLVAIINSFNPLNAALNPICHLLALVGAYPVLHISKIRVKVPKIKKILLYEMKFLVPNYSCLQNPWLGGLPPPRSPFSLSPVLNWICWTPTQTKFLGTPLLEAHPVLHVSRIRVKKYSPYPEVIFSKLNQGCIMPSWQRNVITWHITDINRIKEWYQHYQYKIFHSISTIAKVAAYCNNYDKTKVV